MKHLHTMKVVAKRTGLSPHLIRIWEKRYGAVNPKRTDSGHRLYSDENIERLILLQRATHTGEAIGQIAKLPDEELFKLGIGINDEQENLTSTSTLSQNQNVEYHLNLCLEAVNNLDSINLEVRLLRASITLGQQLFLEKVLQPLLTKTGELWNDGSLKVAHEHLASAVIRSMLGSMIVTSSGTVTGPILISTTPSGQLHEFGALMASVTAASIGWQAIYLGPNIPAEDIAAAAISKKARAVALSLVYPSDDPYIQLELKKLAKMVTSNTQIIVGGRSSETYENTIKEIGAIMVTDLGDLKEKLISLRDENKNRIA
ncbi:MAG: MerR family transcriptional regulator [bacterium]